MRVSLVSLLMSCCICVSSFGAEGLSINIQHLESLRKGLDTPLDEIDRLGKEFLVKYESKADRAQIYFQLCHVHAQSGMKHPDQILKYAEAALETKLIRPDQRATLYSYMASSHEVDKSVKDFSKRRKNALAP